MNKTRPIIPLQYSWTHFLVKTNLEMKQTKTPGIKRLKLCEPKRRGPLNTLSLAITVQVQNFKKITPNIIAEFRELSSNYIRKPKRCEHVTGWTWKL
jgi:predicted nucleotidyltransferase